MSINWRTVTVAAVAAAAAGTATSVVRRGRRTRRRSAGNIIVAAPNTTANKPYAYIVTAEGDVFCVEDNNSVQYQREPCGGEGEGDEISAARRVEGIGTKRRGQELAALRVQLPSGRPDLNRGPPAPKAGAIPGYATPRDSCMARTT